MAATLRPAQCPDNVVQPYGKLHDRRCHICTGTGAHPFHICTGTRAAKSFLAYADTAAECALWLKKFDVAMESERAARASRGECEHGKKKEDCKQCLAGNFTFVAPVWTQVRDSAFLLPCRGPIPTGCGWRAVGGRGVAGAR